MTLAHALLGPENADRTVVLLHGLLANGRNLRSLARGLVERCPGRSALLVDLPGHGETATQGLARDARTVRACADEVAALVRELNVNCDVVIGHSFGGKVAAFVTDVLAAPSAWLLDTTPGADPEWRTRSDVATVLAAISSVRTPVSERASVVGALEQRGLSRGVAEWLTTNLRRTDDGYDWVFDLAQVEALAADYFQIDLLTHLNQRADGSALHLLRAEHGARWSDDDLQRAKALPAGVELHVLPDAGHWVHADNLDGLLELLTHHLE